MRRRATSALLLVAALSCDKPTAPSRGDLSIEVRGLPDTIPFRVILATPRGDSIVVTSDEVLPDLPAGTYTIRPTHPDIAPDVVDVPADTSISVTNGEVSYVILHYRYLTGGATVNAYGLPPGDTALLQVLAPDGTPRALRIPGQHRGLQPGVWTILSVPHERDGDLWTFPPAGTFTVQAGVQAVTFALTYSLQSARVSVRFVNYPEGVPKRAMLVHGFYPDTFRLFGDTLITGVRPTWSYLRGGYHDVFPFRYRSYTDAVVLHDASSTPVSAEVRYGAASGAMLLTATGLPPGIEPRVVLTGWETEQQITVRSDTVPFLTPGGYTVEPIAFMSDGLLYDALPARDIRIWPESVATVALEYRDGAASFDARIDRVIVTQAVQTFDGTVPLLAGRPALVRVLALANRTNTLRPRLRIRVLDGATTRIDTTLTGAFASGIPTARTDGDWATASLPLTAEMVQPGLRVLAELDADDTFDDVDPSNDAWPRAGASGTIAVRDVPPMHVRFVPIRFSNSPPDVDLPSAAAADLLEETYRLHPLQQLAFDIRNEYVTSQPRPGSADGVSWTNIISELEAVRVLEGGSRHYVGVMEVAYTSGIAGLGYVGGRTSLIWSHPGSANAVLAHELGHNFGRLHAPCGSPDGVDSRFPRADGSIGDLGWHAGARTNVPASTPDLMSYCAPAWTSAYTYAGVLAYRDATEPTDRPMAVGEVLLVSGSIVDGAVSLHPVFSVTGSSWLPGSGPHRLQLLDATGTAILTTSFASEALSEATPGTEHFTLAIPAERLGGRSPASLVVSVGGRRAELRAAQAVIEPVPRSITASVRADGRVAIAASGGTPRGFIVRDAVTGLIITIARSAEAVVPFRTSGYVVTVSDGLESLTQRVRPAPR